MFRFRSVVARTITLHLLAIAVTSLFMPLALYLMLKQAAEALHDRALREQAAEIVGYLASGPEGGLRLNLPAPPTDSSNNHGTAVASGEGCLAIASPFTQLPSLSCQVGPAKCLPIRAPS